MKTLFAFFEEADEASSMQPPQKVSEDLVTTFGRHNPPHLGHKLTFDHANDIASNIGDGDSPADQRFYTSKSNDPKKNPLPYQLKLDHLKRMFPEHSEKWDDDGNVKTILNAAGKAHKDGYKNFHFVGGGDRRQGMEDLLRRYNGNLYDFDNIYSHSAGERDESGEGDDPIAALSASRQRKAAMGGDFEGFLGGIGLNDSYTEGDAKELFQMLRKFGVKNEQYLWQVDHRGCRDAIRDVYCEGKLFNRGDLVESLSSGLIGEVHRCGTNHLICVTEDGIMFKNFIYDVNPL